MKRQRIPGEKRLTSNVHTLYAKTKSVSVSKSTLNQKQLMDKEAIPKTRGYRKQIESPPCAPAGDAVLQAPHFQPNLYSTWC